MTWNFLRQREEGKVEKNVTLDQEAHIRRLGLTHRQVKKKAWGRDSRKTLDNRLWAPSLRLTTMYQIHVLKEIPSMILIYSIP